MNSIYFPIMDNGMGLYRTGWALSMMSMLMHRCLKGRKLMMESFSFPYPEGAANIATAAFLMTDCDEMVIVDTDIIFQPHHMEMLLSHKVPLVSGIYPKKNPGLEFPIIPLPSDPEPFKLNGSNLAEVECVPRGFLRIHRDVFELMKKDVTQYICPETLQPSWEFWKNNVGGSSDDFAFCRRYRKL